jgi:hypothetical protein
MLKNIQSISVIALWIIFFIFQVFILAELPLTILALLLCATLLFREERGERYLFALGVVLALIIEVGLGLIARSQHWTNASLFGIPFWLPLIWGYAFVAIRRVGNQIVQRFDET